MCELVYFIGFFAFFAFFVLLLYLEKSSARARHRAMIRRSVAMYGEAYVERLLKSIKDPEYRSWFKKTYIDK